LVNRWRLKKTIKNSELISKKSTTIPAGSDGGVGSGGEEGVLSIGGRQCSGEEAMELFPATFVSGSNREKTGRIPGDAREKTG